MSGRRDEDEEEGVTDEEEEEEENHVDEPLEVATPDAMVFVTDFTQVERRKRRSASSSEVSNFPSTRLHGSFCSIEAQSQPSRNYGNSHNNGLHDKSLLIDNRNHRIHNHFDITDDYLRSQALLTITKSMASSPGKEQTRPDTWQ